MPTFETFFKALVKDVKTELTDEFDRNFERKAFFNEKWQETKWPNSKGSLLKRSGGLRRSLKSVINGETISWTSSRQDAALHNEGGEITVTEKMKRFFWAMYYKASGAITERKDGGLAKTKRNQKLQGESEIWKNLALMKVGQKIKIPKRQFIGHHPQVDLIVKTTTNEHVKRLENDLFNTLKNKK